MKRVTGIGGIFFKANDAPAPRAWYERHLGIDVQAWGGAAFSWTDSGLGVQTPSTTAMTPSRPPINGTPQRRSQCWGAAVVWLLAGLTSDSTPGLNGRSPSQKRVTLRRSAPWGAAAQPTRALTA